MWKWLGARSRSGNWCARHNEGRRSHAAAPRVDCPASTVCAGADAPPCIRTRTSLRSLICASPGGVRGWSSHVKPPCRGHVRTYRSGRSPTYKRVWAHRPSRVQIPPPRHDKGKRSSLESSGGAFLRPVGLGLSCSPPAAFDCGRSPVSGRVSSTCGSAPLGLLAPWPCVIGPRRVPVIRGATSAGSGDAAARFYASEAAKVLQYYLHAAALVRPQP